MARHEGGEGVHCIDIHLKENESIREFVNLANRFPFYIAVRQGRAVVDAKSILGLFSLDRSKAMTVDIYSDNHHELMEALQKFAC